MDSSQNPDKLSCVLIGVDTLLLECAERLLAADMGIQAILTDANRVRTWAEARGIEVRQASDLLAEDVADLPCDYLFSITWTRGLPGFLRDLPRVAAINIQDSPLPRYSGPHGPAWALMAQDRHYGITWHLAEEELGAGEVLHQVPVEIEEGETSLSLNMKCFEAALQGFDKLLPDLAAGNMKYAAQESRGRTRFGLDQRPEHWGCLDWERRAPELEALVRALDYGPYANPFCMAKLVQEGKAVGVGGAIAEPASDDVKIGTILAASQDRGLVVACADGNLRLTSFQSLAGVALELDAVMEHLGLRVGQVLQAPHAGFLSGLSALLPDITHAELRWQQRLGACDALRLAYDRDQDLAPEPLQQLELEVPAAFLEAYPGEERQAAFRALCLVHLKRLARQPSFRVRYCDADLLARVDGFEGLLSASVPLGVELAADASFADTLQSVRLQLDACRTLPPFLKDLQARTRDAETGGPLQLAGIGVVGGPQDPQPEGSFLLYRFDEDRLWLEYAPNRITSEDAGAMVGQLQVLLGAVARAPESPLGHLDLLPAEVLERIHGPWNDTAAVLPEDRLVHELIAAKAAEMGEAVAVVAGGKSLTYAELDARADRLAAYLVSLGAKPDAFVGICMQRTTDMMIGLLAILKSGAGYLPLDPDFPPSRLEYMVKDSGVEIVLSDRWSRGLVEDHVTRLICPEKELPEHEPGTPMRPTPRHLAYAIYTSGSTGDPKGVLLEHEQVTNFFLGMDERLGTEPGVWLAVTSLSFDISVLELLWTLTRGYKVVVFEGFDRGSRAAAHAPAPHDAGQLEFSLMLWGADGGGPTAPDPYRLMMEAARFGEAHDFRAIWLPERHFHDFGGPYPNPAIAAAAIAAVTEKIGLRTGSVVLPLHDPVLMAEDWAMVDNLSGGRVALAIASGWHPNDFILDPDSYEDRKQIMRTRMGQLRSLWRGEGLARPNPIGETPEITTRPRPVQRELPIWLTAAGNPDTFRLAGEMGVHILTHLLGQNVEEVANKIALYRAAWKEAGHPGSGHVTMMLHTMLGEDREAIREKARAPMCRYLATAADLLKDHMSAWAAVRTPMNQGELQTDFHLDDLDPQDVQDLLDFAYERYFETDALFGTPDTCGPMLEKLRHLSVDEVACLIDFGADPEVILEQLPYLQRLKQQVEAEVGEGPAGEALEQLIAEHAVTHLQCTPSMATMLLAEPAIEQALQTLDVMMVGGEALTEDLAGKLRALVPGRVMNMYGLTETAIWSSTADIHPDTETVSLGRPLANNRFYVLDEQLQLVPPGLPGELYLAGLCIARGYHGREDLTAEAFLPDPFEGAADGFGHGALYRSGDTVRQLPDGTMRFLGRGDQQVKVNGYRIELGEIEAALLSHEEVAQSVVLVVTNPFGAKILAAHFVLAPGSALEVEVLRSYLRTCLPEYMVPREFHAQERFPKTNNGKTDRKALARGHAVPEAAKASVAAAVPTVPRAAPRRETAELEQELERIWCDILGLTDLDRSANFFDLGGHSLLTISLKRILQAELGYDVPLVALFRHSTVRSQASFLAELQEGPEAAGIGAGAAVDGAEKKQSAAARRAALRKKRRGGS